MSFSNQFVAATLFTVEFTLNGARFVSGTQALANTDMLFRGTAGSTFLNTSGAANVSCASTTALVDLFVINNCTAGTTNGLAGNISSLAGGMVFSGVNFNSASTLATIGNSVQLIGRIYNPSNPSQIFEPSATGTIITSASPVTATITAGTSQTVDATTTPLAFLALTNGLTITLATVSLTGTGAVAADLTTAVSPVATSSSARLSVTSALLSSGAVSSVRLTNSAGTAQLTITTTAVFSGGSVTFTLAQTDLSTFAVSLAFSGSVQIPSAAAGTVTVTFGADNDEHVQALPSITGTTAATTQGGFNSEVNTFNSSGQAVFGFGSFLRIHNNGGIAGSVTVTVRNDMSTSGAVLGSAFSSSTIQPGGTLQLSADDLEGSSGANIPAAERVGLYTVQVTGPIVGYVQHILFNAVTGQVADLSSFRNSGDTANAP
jgi:hypothetical protein